MGLGKQIAAGAMAVTAFAGLGYGSLKLTEAFNPASKGVTYLESHGYTDVKGGNPNFFSLCGKGEMGRQYTAVNSSGQQVSETVCLGLFWSHKPFLG